MNRQQLEHLAEELRASVDGVAKAAQLLAAGHSGPFLARYRRDETGGLDRQQVARIQRAAAECDRLDEQRATILRSLDTQSKLTDELRAKIEAASSRQELDDLYRPHGPQRPSFADEAKKQGLAELAEAIRQAEPGGSELQQLAAKHAEAAAKSAEANDAVAEGEAALLGAGKILAEQLVDDPGIRDRARRLFRSHGTLVATRADKAQDKKARPFKDFFNYREALAKAPPHRVLAINRGERAKALTVTIECDAAALEQLVGEAAIAADHPHADFLRRAIADGVNQLLIPSLQSEARRDLTDRAEQHA
ncbi:MAG: Tex-like N-terminal domain-containing protein, partial [Planctomycetota bacterium]